RKSTTRHPATLTRGLGGAGPRGTSSARRTLVAGRAPSGGRRCIVDGMTRLRGDVGDMLAVERQVHAAFRRHKEERTVRTFPEALAELERIEDRVDRHIANLERMLERLGEKESVVKSAVGVVRGAVAGMYDKVRDERVSRMLRDDYTLLCFACVCYE